MKKLMWVVLVLLAVIVVAVVAGWLFMDKAVKKGIEVGGTAALGVDTKVDSVSIGVLSSKVGLKGFQIGNPEGYHTDRLMALGEGNVACQISSLLGDEVVVNEILIDQPELTLELKPGLPPKSNIGDLLKKLQSDKEAPPEKEEAESQKTFRVDLIRITGTKVRFHLLAGKTADLVLPDIELKDVKNADGTPLMLADVFGQVLASMGTSAVSKAQLDGLVPAELLAGFSDGLASAQKLLGDSAKQLKAQAQQLQAELGKTVESLKKGVGDLTKGIGAEGVGNITKDLGKGAEGIKEGAGKITKDVGGALKGIFGRKKKKDEAKQ